MYRNNNDQQIEMFGAVLLASICTVPLFYRFHESVTNSCKADWSLNTDGKILSLGRENKLLN